MLYFRMMLIMGVTLYTSRVILEVLGVEDFGIYNVVGGVVVMFGFLNGAISASTSRFIMFELGRKDYVQVTNVFSASIVNHLLIALLILVLAETIGLWFVNTKLVIPTERVSTALWVYQFSILSTMFSMMQIPYNALIIANERMGIYACGSILDSLLKLGIVFLLQTMEGDKLKIYAVLMFCVIAFMFFFYVVMCKRLFSYCSFRFNRDYRLHKTLLSYSGWELFGAFSGVAQGQGLNMLLNLFFGPAVNAARGIAYQVQGAITQFGGNFMTAVRPQIIKYYATGEIEKMMSLVFQSSKYSFFLLWIFTLPLLIEMEYVLSLWLTEVPEFTALFARLVLLLGLVNAWRNPFIAAIHATGKIKIVGIVCGSLLISTLPISYLFLKLDFAASTVFVIALFVTFISMWVEWILIRRSVYFSITAAVQKVILKSLAVVALSCSLPLLINRHFVHAGFLSFSTVVILSLLCTVFAVYFVGIEANERNIIYSKIKKNLHL